VAWTLNNLALVYRDQGKYTEAAGLFERALTIREKALGGSPPVVGQSLNNLAFVYWTQGKYRERDADLKIKAFTRLNTVDRLLRSARI
jgi:tetratricopeptide (TPR) repeat protein